MAVRQANDFSGLFETLDHFGPLPMWFQIADRLERAIADGEIPINSKLESEAAFAGRLRVSRQTVRRAQQELVSRGLLVRRRGIGTEVTARSAVRSSALTGLYDELIAAGRAPTTTVLAIEQVMADGWLSARTGITVGASLVRVERVRYADGVPIAVLVNWLPPALRPPTVQELESRGLYSLLRDQGVVLRSAEQAISGRGATGDEAQLLHAKPGDAVMTMTRLVRGAAGDFIEYGVHCSLLGVRTFEMTLVAP